MNQVVFESVSSPDELRREAEIEIERVLTEKNCRLSIEEIIRDGVMFQRRVIVVPVEEC